MSRTFKIVSGILIGLLLMVVAALGAYVAIRKHPAGLMKPGERVPVAVTITDKTCDPNTLTVEAGRNTFAILNKSDRAVEWEILQGVMVVEERENIAPGFTSKLTAKLEPGHYEITCGLLTNPRGKLIVTASAEPGAKKKPSTADLLGPMSEYMLYVHGEADALVKNVSAFTAAIREGNLTRGEALSLYVAARTPYKRIEPVALPFSDLDAAIDARAAYLEKREQDPAFTGFHRLEYGLFEKRSRDGLVPVAGKLDADAALFAARLKETVPPPEKVVMGAAKMIERDAAMTVSGDENRYASTGLADIAANVEGARKIADLMKSLTGKTDPALAERIDAGFAAVEETLAKHRTPEGGFVSFDLLSDSDRAELNVPLTRLAESLSRLGGALGLG